MSQLTAEERRRAFEHRQAAPLGARRPRAITLEQLGREHLWPRAVRLGAVLALAVVALLLLAQSARVVSRHGGPALIEWLLPRV